MKKAILILLTVLLAVSCSQVVYDNLPPVEIGGKYSTTLTAIQDGTSAALKLRFNAVPYITQYGYDINGSAIKEIPDSEIKVIGGDNYEFTIHSEDINNQYNGEIYLYGKVHSEIDTEEWVNIGSTAYSIAIEGTAPVVNLYARNETEAVLNLVSPPVGMIYKVEVKNSNGDLIEELSVSDLLPEIDGRLYIRNLEEDQSYIFDVYQKKVGGENEYPTVYSSVEVGAFTSEVKLVLTEDKNTGFVVEIAEDLTGISTVTLVNDTTNTELATVDVTENSATFTYDQIPSLESGLFYAKTTSAGEEYVSNYVDTITPITVLEMTPNYRSVDLKVKFSDQITDPATDITFSTPGLASGTFEYIEQEDGTYLLVINGLSSNTSYPNLSLRATINNNRITALLDHFMTKSFAGNFFEWEGKFKNGNSTKFIIYVDNAPEGSDYPYYVYFSENDPAMSPSSTLYKKSDLRIMPLVDSSTNLLNPEPETSEKMQVECESGKAGDNDLSLQNEAYIINSKKWNTMSATLISWYIVNGDGYPFDEDIVMTTTKTKAKLFVTIDSETCTSFYFMEKDLNGDNIPEPFIKFVNAAGSDGYANIGLAKNSASESEWKSFESEKPEDSEHTFYLSPVFLLEGGV